MTSAFSLGPAASRRGLELKPRFLRILKKMLLIENRASIPFILNLLNWNSSEQRLCFDPSFCWNMERLYSCILINLRLVPFEYFQNMDKPFRISKIEFMPGTESRDISTNPLKSSVLSKWCSIWLINYERNQE